MKVIEFIGNGVDDTELCSPGVYHSFGVIGGDFTLCGISLDNDTGTIGEYHTVNSKINCPLCIAVIEFCKKIPNPQISKGQLTSCQCAPDQGGPCSFCMEMKYNL